MENKKHSVKLSKPLYNEAKEGFFSIQDEGVGIAEEKLKEIFKPYERGSQIAGGFGIGLSIVKQICDEFKIKIDVESKVDKGSCFTLTW